MHLIFVICVVYIAQIIRKRVHILKFCCNDSVRQRRKRNSIRINIIIGITLIFVGVAAAVICTEGIIRSVLKGYPMSIASTMAQQFCDKAMKSTIEKYGYNSSEIDKVKYSEKGEVLSIEADTALITKIKTDFSNELNRLYAKQGDDFVVKVPLGTLIGSDLTIGMGPEIKFTLRYSCTSTIKLKSDFSDAGINNTIHTIRMDIINDIYIVLPLSKCSKTQNSEFILAETVITGKVPEAYTNVYDGSGDITEDIFNYGAELE